MPLHEWTCVTDQSAIMPFCSSLALQHFGYTRSAIMPFASFCPQGGECNHKGRRLGTDKSESDARWRISNHLQTSSYHQLDEIAADEIAASCTAEVQEEEEEAAPVKGKGRVVPYEHGRKGKGGGGGKGKGWEGGGSSGSGMPVQMTLQVGPASSLEKVLMHISRAEAAARTSGRMARAAEEAGHLRDCIAELTGEDRTPQF